MKLNQAIELGKECALHTIGEAITNVCNHSISLFLYEKIDEEIKELIEDFKASGRKLDEVI